MPRKPRILLATPTYHCGVLECAGNWMPLALTFLGGALDRSKFDVVLYDAMSEGADLDGAVRRIAEINPDLIAVGGYTASFPSALDMLRRVKQMSPRVVTVCGGVHATFMWRDILAENPFVDYVIVGEGELPFRDMLNQIFDGGMNGGLPRGVGARVDGRIVSGGRREFVRDLDTLSPDYGLLDWSIYKYHVIPNSTLGSISTSRGCSEGCSFCSQQKFWNRTWRAISPDKFEQLARELIERHGVNVILIPDERPTTDRGRWEEIIDRMIGLKKDVMFLMETTVVDILRDADILWKYRKAGIIHIYVGVEAAGQDRLDDYNKKLSVEESKEALRLINAADIVSETSFVLGTPDETPQSIAFTLKQAKRFNPDFAHFLLLTPWPYSDIYAQVKPHIEEWDFSKYNLVEPVIRPKNMSRDEIFTAVLRCYRDFYMDKLSEVRALKNDFKREYMMRSMKVMMHNSFLKSHLLRLGELPRHISAHSVHEAV